MKAAIAVAVLILAGAVVCAQSSKQGEGEITTFRGKPVHEIVCLTSSPDAKMDLSCYMTDDGALWLTIDSR